MARGEMRETVPKYQTVRGVVKATAPRLMVTQPTRKHTALLYSRRGRVFPFFRGKRWKNFSLSRPVTVRIPATDRKES